MKAIARSTLVLVQALALQACAGDDNRVSCTLEVRTAVVVHVTSPDDLVVDRVTATRARESECHPSFAEDAGSAQSYDCWEQGGGTYVIRVQSGEMTWTKRVEVDADECHVTEREEVTVVLDPKTAD